MQQLVFREPSRGVRSLPRAWRTPEASPTRGVAAGLPGCKPALLLLEDILTKSTIEAATNDEQFVPFESEPSQVAADLQGKSAFFLVEDVLADSTTETATNDEQTTSIGPEPSQDGVSSTVFSRTPSCSPSPTGRGPAGSPRARRAEKATPRWHGGVVHGPPEWHLEDHVSSTMFSRTPSCSLSPADRGPSGMFPRTPSCSPSPRARRAARATPRCRGGVVRGPPDWQLEELARSLQPSLQTLPQSFSAMVREPWMNIDSFDALQNLPGGESEHVSDLTEPRWGLATSSEDAESVPADTRSCLIPPPLRMNSFVANNVHAMSMPYMYQGQGWPSAYVPEGVAEPSMPQLHRGGRGKRFDRKVQPPPPPPPAPAVVVKTSVGSVGHPFNCGEACKYATRPKGCKDGAACTHCHHCEWSRRPGKRNAMKRRICGKF